MNASKVFHFEASHIIPGKGICSDLHGYSWTLEVGLLGDPQSETGSLFDDQSYLKHLVTPILQRLNGWHLNYFIKLPTIENVCLHIARELNSKTAANLSVCRLSVPSVFSAEWNQAMRDDELFKDQFSQGAAIASQHYFGYADTFEEIPAFATMQARARWINECRQKLRRLYTAMTEVGSHIAAFERYQASLDAEAAAQLMEYIKNSEEMEEK